MVMVPRIMARAWVESRRVIQAEPQSKWAVRNCIQSETALSAFIEEALAAATQQSPIRGEGWLGSDYAPPVPSVSGGEDQGSSAKEADTHRVAETAVVAVEPSDGLLVSMAMRWDHGLGCPGYYDQPLFGGVGHEARLRSAMATMRQLHEEVVGTGFYSPEREAEYAARMKTTTASAGGDEAKRSEQKPVSGEGGR